MLDGNGGREGIGAAWPGLVPGNEVAGFIIEGLLATGSFGVIYRARRGERRFALKLLPLDPRSNREMDALRRMRHPNVVGFHGCGVWPDEQPRALVLALELVEGRPLDVWAQEENPSALELVGRVLLPLALTLADVHASGVVHRDIKEANIVMREADGLPVLVDFGAAVYEGAERLTLQLPPGTSEYRSPEAWRFAREWEGKPYTARPGDDLWALGVVTYLLMTGVLPFGDRHDPGMVRAILHETPLAPHERNRRVPPALGDVCMRMLEKKPEARYPGARALAEALATEWTRADRSWRVPLLPEAGSREGSTPPPPPRVLQRQTRRRWWIAGLALAACVGAVSLFIARRSESPAPPPPLQASPRQEMASVRLTGEVGSGAEPWKSPTPAPVATATSREEPDTMKSKKARSLTTAALVATSTCVGAGCAGIPMRQPPPPAECPPGSEATFERFGIRMGETQTIFIPPYSPPRSRTAIVSEGDVTAMLMGSWKELPDATPLYGKLFFGKGRVHARFTQARLRSGELVPVCMELMYKDGTGMAMQPGSTSDKAIIPNPLFVEAMDIFS
jgi:eukaryotic-like serine/threonine-protein kinase